MEINPPFSQFFQAFERRLIPNPPLLGNIKFACFENFEGWDRQSAIVRITANSNHTSKSKIPGNGKKINYIEVQTHCIRFQEVSRDFPKQTSIVTLDYALSCGNRMPVSDSQR